jgi:hypothetical protein
MQYLEHLVSVAQPSRLLYLALDGVMPEAKLPQMRKLRFLAEHYEGIRSEIQKEVCRTHPPFPLKMVYSYIACTPFIVLIAGGHRWDICSCNQLC